MRKYGDKVLITSYVDEDLYRIIEAERKKTGESQSGIIYSILEAVFREPVSTEV